MSNEKAFFYSFQTCNFVGRSQHLNDGAITQQSRNGNFEQGAGMAQW